MRDIIAVTSGKGGQGKSTLALGIGAAYCKLGKRVLIIDLDAGMRSVDLLANISEEIVCDITDLLEGREIEDVVIPVTACPKMDIIPAPQKNFEFNEIRLAALITSIFGYDLIILNFPSGISVPFTRGIAKIADFAVVTTADAVGVKSGYETASFLKECGADDVRIIINKYDIAAVKKGVFSGIDDIIDATECRLLGVVPHDKKLVNPHPGEIFANVLLGPALSRIAKRIEGYNVPLPDIKKLQKGK